MAGKPAYIINDLAPDSDPTFSGVSMSSVYPLLNVVDGVLARPTHFDSGVIKFHLNASPFVGYDSLFIGNTNIVSADGIRGFYIKAQNSSPTPGGEHGPFIRNGSRNLFIDLTAAATDANLIANAHYLAITPNNVDGADLFTEIGEIIIGPRVELPRAPFGAEGVGVSKSNPTSGIENKTLGGIKYRYKLSKSRIIQPTFRFPESEFEAFLAFSQAVEAIPFVYIPDVTTNEAYYCTKPFGFDPHAIGRKVDDSGLTQWYDWSPPFETESEGILGS